MKTTRLTGLLGVAAVTVYVVATGLGSILDPSYSQLRRHVSDLTATGSSTWAVLVLYYVTYNVLCLTFAWALYISSPRTRQFKLGSGLLMANAVAGIMMVTAFREDLGGSPNTWIGWGHVVFATMSSLTIFLAAIAYGYAFRPIAGWRPLAAFSFGTAAAMAVFAPLAVLAINGPLAGLAERGAIALFLAWMLGVSAYALAPAGRATTGLERRPD